VPSGKLTGNQVVAFQFDRNLPLASRVAILEFNTHHCLADNASVVQVEFRASITVGIVGFPVRSQYLPLVATVAKSQVLA
jgi:hypothetical protein